MTWLVASALMSFALSVVATPIVRSVALRLGYLDRRCDLRRVHNRAVPRIGGVGMVAAFVGGLLLALLFPGATGRADGAVVLTVAGSAVAMAVVGFYDDTRGLGARTKLAWQVAVATVLYAAGLRIESVHAFGHVVTMGALSYPITVLWVAGVINAVNLVDGLDGLAGGVAIAAAIAAFQTGAHAVDPTAMLLAATVVGGVLGFLLYNVYPASIFMGDTGSLFVGTVLAALALRPHLPEEQADPVLIMSVALAFPIADTALAMLRRTACGVPMFLGDREHVHHRLIDRGLSQPRAVAVLWAASMVLAGCGVWMASHGDSAFLLALAVVAAGVLALGKLGCIPWPTAALRQRRRVNRARLRAVRSVERQLKRARSVAAVAEHLAAAAPALGADAVRLCAGPPPPPPAAGRARASLPVDALRPGLGSLEIVWTDPTSRLDRDAELALEILGGSVAVALDRIERDALAEALWRWRLERAVRPPPVRRARSVGPGDGVGRRA